MPNTAPLDWQRPCRAVFNCTRRKLLIRHVCFFQLFLQRRMRRRWRTRETWLGDECPHYYAFQKSSLSMRNGEACTQAQGKLPFSLTCSQGWGSEWKAIRECLPSEVMNTVQIRGRGLLILSTLAFSILTAQNCFLSFAPQPIPCLCLFFRNLSLLFFHFFLSSPSQLPPQCTGYEGVWVDRLSSGRSGEQGQHLQIVGQKAETARPSVRTQCAARIARPCRVTENRDLEPWAEKKLTQIHRVWHRNTGLPALQMCAHIAIWYCAQNGLDRTPHELLWKAFLLQCTTER